MYAMMRNQYDPTSTSSVLRLRSEFADRGLEIYLYQIGGFFLYLSFSHSLCILRVVIMNSSEFRKAAHSAIDESTFSAMTT